MPQPESSSEELWLVAVARPSRRRAPLGHVLLVEMQHGEILPTLSTLLHEKGAPWRGSNGQTVTWVKLVLKTRS